MGKVKALASLPLPPYSSDLIDRALRELERNSYDTDQALAAMQHADLSTFPRHVEWTPAEIDQFEQAIASHGHDLYQVNLAIPSKPHADVVRFFYLWKKSDRYEQVYSKWTDVYKPTKRFKSQKRAPSTTSSESDSGEESDDLTVVRVSPALSKAFQCDHCHTTHTSAWRRLPTDVDRKRKHFKHVLCNACGEYWLKYGVMRKLISPLRLSKQKSNLKSGDPVAVFGASSSTSFINATPASAAAAAAARGMKRKASSTEIQAKLRKMKDEKPVPRAPSPCAVCAQMDPTPRLLTCQTCGMSVHDGKQQKVTQVAQMESSRPFDCFSLFRRLLWCPCHDIQRHVGLRRVQKRTHPHLLLRKRFAALTLLAFLNQPFFLFPFFFLSGTNACYAIAREVQDKH